VRLTITRFKSNFYVILITKRTLLQYFESHQIHIVTSYGLEDIVENYLAIGRIFNWALQLMGLNITYAPQMAIKSQTLADFVAKWTETQRPQPPKSTTTCISMALSLSIGLGEAWCYT
jgi:hypothetical protein